MTVFTPLTNPVPVELSDRQRKKARTLCYQGTPLLHLPQTTLVALLLETNDTLEQMSRHMKAHMATCRDGRMVIPAEVVIQ